jgi:hypothetical protein
VHRKAKRDVKYTGRIGNQDCDERRARADQMEVTAKTKFQNLLHATKYFTGSGNII